MLIPELEAIAIIPSWAIDVNLPCGMIKDRRGGKMHAAEQLRMVHQIHEVYAGQLRRMGEMLAGFDNIAGRLADEIAVREQRLAELDEQIRQRTLTKEEPNGSNTPAA